MNSANEVLASRNHFEKWVPLMELAVREVFELMLGSQLSPTRANAQGVLDITAMVGLAGELCGLMSLRCGRDTAARMAAKMLGTQPESDSQEVQDAFGEVCNMVAGNFKHKISGVGANCALSVPTVITGSDYTLRSLADSDAMVVNLLFEEKPFVVSLEVHT